MSKDNSMDKAKPERAKVFMTKIISGFETLVQNIVNYNDDPKAMILDAVMQETHNYSNDDIEEVIANLKSNDYTQLDDGYEINLVIEWIEPFTEKELDKDMFLTIKYPSI